MESETERVLRELVAEIMKPEKHQALVALQGTPALENAMRRVLKQRRGQMEQREAMQRVQGMRPDTGSV